MSTPRARASKELRDEILEFLDFLYKSRRWGEITKEFYNEIKSQVDAISFDDLAQQRKYLKKGERTKNKKKTKKMKIEEVKLSETNLMA